MNKVTAPPKSITKVAAAPIAKLQDVDEFNQDLPIDKTDVPSPVYLDNENTNKLSSPVNLNNISRNASGLDMNITNDNI